MAGKDSVIFPLRLRGALGLALACLALTGCDSGAAMAPVRGTVIADGQPVTEGSLMFAPDEEGKAARPATAVVQPDGTFVLGTEKDADGAAIGRHKVLYTPPNPTGPAWDGYGPKPVMKESPFTGLVPKEPEVEVKAGENEIMVELVRKKP